MNRIALRKQDVALLILSLGSQFVTLKRGSHLKCLAWKIAARTRGVYNRRMPRMQVYLPADLYKVLKSRRLPASELLQRAVRSELRRLELLAATDRYVDKLVARVGTPTTRDQRRASAIVERVGARPKRKAG